MQNAYSKYTFYKNSSFSLINSKRYLGILLTSIAWILVALTAPKVVRPSLSINFHSMCFFQFLVSFGVLAIAVTLRGRAYVFSKNPISIVLNSILSLFAYFAYFSLHSSPQSFPKSLFLNSESLLVASIATFFFKKRLPKFLWLGNWICFISILILRGYKPFILDTTTLTSCLFSFIAALSLALLIISSKHLIKNGNSPMVVALYNAITGLVCFGLIVLFKELEIPSGSEWLYICIGGFSYSLAVCLFTLAHRYIEYYYIMPLNYLMTIFTLILHAHHEHQVFHVFEWMCVMGLGTGILLVFLSKPTQSYIPLKKTDRSLNTAA